MRGLVYLFILILFNYSSSFAALSDYSVQDLKNLLSADIRNQKPIDLTIASKVQVFVFISSVCPCSDSHIAPLKKLAVKYQNQVQFYGIHSNLEENHSDSLSYYKSKKIPFPVILDQNNQLARKLKPLATPHTYVFNQKGELVYRGGVDNRSNALKANQHYLSEVLKALTTNKPIPYTETRVLGCPMDYKF